MGCYGVYTGRPGSSAFQFPMSPFFVFCQGPQFCFLFLLTIWLLIVDLRSQISHVISYLIAALSKLVQQPSTTANSARNNGALFT